MRAFSSVTVQPVVAARQEPCPAPPQYIRRYAMLMLMLPMRHAAFYATRYALTARVSMPYSRRVLASHHNIDYARAQLPSSPYRLSTFYGAMPLRVTISPCHNITITTSCRHAALRHFRCSQPPSPAAAAYGAQVPKAAARQRSAPLLLRCSLTFDTA